MRSHHKSKQMSNVELCQCDPEDIEDAIAAVERSLGVGLDTDKYPHITTFGELCQLIQTDVAGSLGTGCTSQQAFYKLRTAVAQVLSLPAGEITPATELKTLFPAETRRAKLKEVNDYLGVKLGWLTPSDFVTACFLLLACIGLLCLFASLGAGSALLFLACGGYYLVARFTKRFARSTFGDMASMLATLHYASARRKTGTINPAEVQQLIIDVFCNCLPVGKEALTPDATFV